MFVRMLTGAHAGEVREVKFETGRDLVANGRAEKIDLSTPSAEARDRRAAADPHEGPKPGPFGPSIPAEKKKRKK